MPSFQIGIWRSSSGVREARCSSASVSRTRRVGRVDLVDEQEARDVRLPRARAGSTSRAGTLRSSASHTTTAASQAGSDGAHLVQEFHRAGAIDEGHRLAEESDASRRSARRSSVGARLGARIADAVSVGDAARR